MARVGWDEKAKRKLTREAMIRAGYSELERHGVTRVGDDLIVGSEWLAGKVLVIPAEYHTSANGCFSPPKMRGTRKLMNDQPFPRDEALDWVLGPCAWCGSDFVDDGTGACNSCYGPRDGKLWQR